MAEKANNFLVFFFLVLLAPPAVTQLLLLRTTSEQVKTKQEKHSPAMAATPAYAAAAAAGETAAALSRDDLRGTRPPVSRFAFLAKSPARWAISLSAVRRHAAPAAAASEERVPEEEGPAWVELEPICSEQHLDQALAEAQQLDVPIVLLWMASWCRKCIYLKPKLEKLAAEYHPRIRFFSVDVNAVPQKLVSRAGVTKMPSIQLWSDSGKQAEVIGGHKSWLVIDDVRSMIEREE